MRPVRTALRGDRFLFDVRVYHDLQRGRVGCFLGMAVGAQHVCVWLVGLEVRVAFYDMVGEFVCGFLRVVRLFVFNIRVYHDLQGGHACVFLRLAGSRVVGGDQHVCVWPVCLEVRIAFDFMSCGFLRVVRFFVFDIGVYHDLQRSHACVFLGGSIGGYEDVCMGSVYIVVSIGSSCFLGWVIFSALLVDVGFVFGGGVYHDLQGCMVFVLFERVGSFLFRSYQDMCMRLVFMVVRVEHCLLCRFPCFRNGEWPIFRIGSYHDVQM